MTRDYLALGDVLAIHADQIEQQFRAQLHFGVTTARSIGSDSPERVAHLLGSAGRPDANRAISGDGPWVAARPAGVTRRRRS